MVNAGSALKNTAANTAAIIFIITCPQLNRSLPGLGCPKQHPEKDVFQERKRQQSLEIAGKKLHASK